MLWATFHPSTHPTTLRGSEWECMVQVPVTSHKSQVIPGGQHEEGHWLLASPPCFHVQGTLYPKHLKSLTGPAPVPIGIPNGGIFDRNSFSFK